MLLYAGASVRPLPDRIFSSGKGLSEFPLWTYGVAQWDTPHLHQISASLLLGFDFGHRIASGG